MNETHAPKQEINSFKQYPFVIIHTELFNIT